MGASAVKAVPSIITSDGSFMEKFSHHISENGKQIIRYCNSVDQDPSCADLSQFDFTMNTHLEQSLSLPKNIMVVLYDFAESMKSQISIKRGEFVRLLAYSPAGDWSEVETCDSLRIINTGSLADAEASNLSSKFVSENGYRRGWVPTSYLSPANAGNSYNPFPSQPNITSDTIQVPQSVRPSGNVSSVNIVHQHTNIPICAPQITIEATNAHMNIVNASLVNMHGQPLSMYPWYHGAVSRQAGEQLLRLGVTGSFLVRASESSPGQLSVTVRHLGRVYHYRINQDAQGCYFITNIHRFPSVVQLVEHHSKSADGLVCPLLYPVPKQQMSVNHLQPPYSCVSAPSKTSFDPQISSGSHPVIDSCFNREPTNSMPTNADVLGWSTPHSVIDAAHSATSSVGDQSSFALDGWEVDRNEIIMCQKLGCGQYGDVYEATWKKHNMVVAVKTLKQNVNLNVNDFLKEASIMKKLRHQNLVQLLGVCTREPPLYLITEYMPYGNLLNYLRGRTPGDLSPPILLYMAVQIASGMAYLEANSFIHRDLAARNCLVGEQNLIKVADFGLARYMQRQDKTYTARNGAKFPIKWTAPEGLAYYLFSSKSDVWAFGVVLWELATYGLSPYPGVELHDVYHLLEKGYRMKRPHGCPEAVYAIMLRCWEWEAKHRPSFREIHTELDQMCCTMNIEAEVAHELEKHSLQSPTNQTLNSRFSNANWTNPPSAYDPRIQVQPPNTAYPSHNIPPITVTRMPHLPPSAFYHEQNALHVCKACPTVDDDVELNVTSSCRQSTKLGPDTRTDRGQVEKTPNDLEDTRGISSNTTDVLHLQNSVQAISIIPRNKTPGGVSSCAHIPAHSRPSESEVVLQSRLGHLNSDRVVAENRKPNGRNARQRARREVVTQNGTSRSRDTDTPDESGVGESIISNDYAADSTGDRSLANGSTATTPIHRSITQNANPLSEKFLNNHVANSSHLGQFSSLKSTPHDTNHHREQQQQQILQIAKVSSNPVLRLCGSKINSASSISREERICHYLKSLDELNESPTSESSLAPARTSFSDSHPCRQNEFLVFLNYPPPPPSNVREQREPPRDGTENSPQPLLQLSLSGVAEAKLNCLESCGGVHPRFPQSSPSENSHEDVPGEFLTVSRSNASRLASSQSCSDDDVDDVYQAPDSCYPSKLPNTRDPMSLVEFTSSALESLLAKSTAISQALTGSALNLQTVSDQLNCLLDSLTSLLSDSILFANYSSYTDFISQIQDLSVELRLCFRSTPLSTHDPKCSANIVMVLDSLISLLEAFMKRLNNTSDRLSPTQNSNTSSPIEASTGSVS